MATYRNTSMSVKINGNVHQDEEFKQQQQQQKLKKIRLLNGENNGGILIDRHIHVM
jgi:hypothetical protein